MSSTDRLDLGGTGHPIGRHYDPYTGVELDTYAPWMLAPPGQRMPFAAGRTCPTHIPETHKLCGCPLSRYNQGPTCNVCWSRDRERRRLDQAWAAFELTLYGPRHEEAA
jgi:hypothetical protein